MSQISLSTTWALGVKFGHQARHQGSYLWTHKPVKVFKTSSMRNSKRALSRSTHSMATDKGPLGSFGFVADIHRRFFFEVYLRSREMKCKIANS